MILIAPDKFKGTLSASEVARIIAEEIADDCRLAPMADGGEGTAEILCRTDDWQFIGDCFINVDTKEAVIDSSAVIGLSMVDPASHDILAADSSALGLRVRQLLEMGARRVTIGVGGTNCCDGGMGFYHALGRWRESPHRFMGLVDVKAPLLGALDFAPQKGARPQHMPILRNRLETLLHAHPGLQSEFDGAGGGLGFALASLIGAPCRLGAKYVLDSYDIEWDDVSLVITGEGRIDSQTSQGKVVAVVESEARRRGISCIAIGGTVDESLRSATCISADEYLPDSPLTKVVAEERLRMAVRGLLERWRIG